MKDRVKKLKPHEWKSVQVGSIEQVNDWLSSLPANQAVKVKVVADSTAYHLFLPPLVAAKMSTTLTLTYG